VARPMLDDLELQQVQTIQQDGDQVWTQHSIPALEGDFFQGLGRRASQITLQGVLTGAEVADGLKNLRDKFRGAQPVSFVADIATATRIDQVLIEEMGVRELAGKPSRFEYAFTLREYTPATPTEVVIPPEPPEPPEPEVEESVLEVEVIVEGQTDFDHSRTTVRVEGTDQDGNTVSRTLTEDQRNDSVWEVDPFPAGRYTAFATTSAPTLTGSSETADLPLGQRRRLMVVLRSGQDVAFRYRITYWFDKAFIEPCQRHVMRQVAQRAMDNPDEKLVIVGHTDESGSAEYNQSLSERRARGAYAYLIFGRDPASADAAVAEWDELRKTRTTGVFLTTRDTWGPRQYMQMLQELGYYSGTIGDAHTATVDQAVRLFQADNGLGVDGDVGDQTWPVLIRAYLSLDSLKVPEDRFMPNAKDGCDHGVVRWLGCGERMPEPSTPRSNGDPPDPRVTCGDPGWRPNRRTDFLFVRAAQFPCDVPKPVTFNLPVPNSGGTGWCLGRDEGPAPQDPCCYLVDDPNDQGSWLVEDAEPATFEVRGRITFVDGTPLANTAYVLTASDGEYMNGEQLCGTDGPKGTPIPGRTDANGNLVDRDGNIGYPNNLKGVGVFTLDIDLAPPLVARLAEAPPSAAKGPVVCKRMDGSSDLLVIVGPPGSGSSGLQFVSENDVEVEVEGAAQGDSIRLRADVAGIDSSVTEIMVEVSSTAVPGGSGPGPGPVTEELAFADPADLDTPVDSAAAGGNLRLRADLPNVGSGIDEVLVEVSSTAVPGGPGPGPGPVTEELAFVDPADLDTPVDSAAAGGNLRLRADLPNVGSGIDEVLVEISS